MQLLSERNSWNIHMNNWSHVLHFFISLMPFLSVNPELSHYVTNGLTARRSAMYSIRSCSFRQMLIGKFAEEKAEEVEQVEETEENAPEQKIDPAPFEMAGFDWKRFTQKSFSGISRELRFILSNKNVYDNYRKHRHFWVSDGESSGALALKCDEEETDPLEFLGGVKLRKNGYVIVCVDKKTNKLYIPE